jgi:Tol biopolymer transport system component
MADRSWRSTGGSLPLAQAGAVVVLLVTVVLTMSLFGGQLPSVGPGQAANGAPPGADPGRTPTPSNVVVVAASAGVPGEIVFVKGGNVWLEANGAARQVTAGGDASMPAWSADGRWIYYVQSVRARGWFPNIGASPVFYRMSVPVLWRVHPDGSGAQRLADGVYHTGPRGSWTWFYWLRQPTPSPDGRTVALVSDAPDPTRSDVVLQLLDLRTHRLTKPPLAEDPPLGHQDPAWRPDGKQLAYVVDGRNLTRGAPAIAILDVASGRSRLLTGPGYLSPSFSPDGRYLAATRTSALGTDVVVLDARTGSELLSVTDDGASWSPDWSPNGDAIAFLHLSYQTVDLRVATLGGTAGRWQVTGSTDVTEYSGLDGSSRPSWFIPPTSAGQPGASPAASRAQS